MKMFSLLNLNSARHSKSPGRTNKSPPNTERLSVDQQYEHITKFLPPQGLTIHNDDTSITIDVRKSVSDIIDGELEMSDQTSYDEREYLNSENPINAVALAPNLKVTNITYE